MSAKISFSSFDQFAGWDKATETVKQLISQYRGLHILEIGSGANPTLPIDYVQIRGIEYTTNDISHEELAKAPHGFQKLLLDINCASLPDRVLNRYDFIFSRMVNEHVKDGEHYYRNIYAMLAPGGITTHWFSTLYALPFLVNRLMPDGLTNYLLNIFAPRDRHQHEKFRAYYSWSRGPSARMIRRFEGIGFNVLQYKGHFGHGYYARRLPWLHKLELKKANWFVRHPQPWACSYAHIVLQRPLK
jgi:2-polyprenyl-3-methyl-5-hydroxy-6-metoxy-1,4-benzoquinol methylase